MATPTPSPAEPVPEAAPPVVGALTLDPALADPKAPPQRDSRMDFLPDGSLDGRFGSSDSLSAAELSGTGTSGGYSGIKVETLGEGPIRARGSISDGVPMGLLVLVALALGWLIWRFIFRSGRVNFAGQDGNR